MLIAVNRCFNPSFPSCRQYQIILWYYIKKTYWLSQSLTRNFQLRVTHILHWTFLHRAFFQCQGCGTHLNSFIIQLCHWLFIFRTDRSKPWTLITPLTTFMATTRCRKSTASLVSKPTAGWFSWLIRSWLLRLFGPRRHSPAIAFHADLRCSRAVLFSFSLGLQVLHPL